MTLIPKAGTDIKPPSDASSSPQVSALPIAGPAEPVEEKPAVPQTAATHALVEGYEAATKEKHGWNPVLDFLNRFGQTGPRNEAEREQDLAYRAEREAELQKAFPSLSSNRTHFEDALKKSHGILNKEKEFSFAVKLSSMITGHKLLAGEYRTGPNRAGPYLAPAGKDVPALMGNFARSVDRMLAQGVDDEGARLIAAWALTVIIRVHPFMDGNGRTARTAMNLVLAKAHQKTIDFPVDSDGVYKRSEVWSALKGHMRTFTGPAGVNWSMEEGMVPPHDYNDRLRTLLMTEIEGTSVQALAARPDIARIANALKDVQQHGFQVGAPTS